MKHLSRVFTAALCVVLLASILLPTAAFAAETSRYTDNGAYADFYSSDGCIEQYAFLTARENMEHSPGGPPEVGAWVSVYVSTYDYCNETGTSAFGEKLLENGEFQVSKNLQSASLNTTVTVTEYDSWTGNELDTFDISVQLDWTGVGDVYNGQTSYRTKIGQCMYRDRYIGSDRPAEPSGSISGGGIEYAAGANAYGWLYSTKNGSVVVDCY